jgi:hypothetical protein
MVNYVSRLHARESNRDPNLSTPEPDGPVACDIDQQCSSATFVSLHFHSLKKQFGRVLQKCYYFKFLKLFKRFLCPKLYNVKLRKLGRVCGIVLFASLYKYASHND